MPILLVSGADDVVGDFGKGVLAVDKKLREYGANIAAGCIKNGWFDMAGFGRQAFAYPDFANDIVNGGMERNKCCVACSKCTVMMRDGGVAGCSVRDGEVYLPLYKKGREGKPSANGTEIKEIFS